MIKRLSKTICLLMCAAMIVSNADYVLASQTSEAYAEEENGIVTDGLINIYEKDEDTEEPVNTGDTADSEKTTDSEETVKTEQEESEDIQESEDTEESDEFPKLEELTELEDEAELESDSDEIQEETAAGKCGDNLTYTVEKLTTSVPDYRLTITGTGDMYNFKATNIPWSAALKTARNVELIIGDGVASIGERAFYGVPTAGEVTIPASVKSIGMSAFNNNINLTKVYFEAGSSLEIINDYAFNGCTSLSSELVWPESLVTVGNGAFQNCSRLQGGFTPGSNLKTVGKNAFYGCTNLSGEFVPDDNLESIGDYAFSGCNRLKSTSGMIFDGNLTKIGTEAFKDCSSLKGDLRINGAGLVIGANAFQKCTGFNGSLIIGDGVRTIGAGAFSECSIINQDMIIGNGVEVIGTGAFKGITRVSGSLVIGSSLTTLGNDAFDSINPKIVINNSDKKITIPGKKFIDCDSRQTVTEMGYGRYYATTLSNYKTIRLDANGGIIGDGTTYDFPYVRTLEGIDGVDIKKVNCRFDGWYTQRVGGTLMTRTSTIPTGVTTLYAHWTVTIVGTVENPAATTESGTAVDSGTAVKLSTPTVGAKIYYTLDGSIPDADSTLFDNVIRIYKDTVITAIAIKDCYADSEVVTFSYSLKEDDYEEVDITDANEAGYLTPSQIPDRFWVAGVTEMPYTGSKIVLPNLHVYYGKKLLAEGKDYNISYSANTNVGNAEVKVTGKGNYEGTLTRKFAITRADIATELEFKDIILPYNASKPQLQKAVPKEIYDKNGKSVSLHVGRDYECVYPDSSAGAYIDCGEYSVVINGTGNYKGNVTIKEIITEKYDMSLATINRIANVKHTGLPIEPAVTVKYKGNIVSSDNYTVEYSNNTDIGTATVTVVGKNSFIGSKKTEFSILSTSLSETKYQGYVSSYPYTGSAIYQDGYFYDANQCKILVENSDYTAEYTDNISPGQVTVVYRGINGYTGNKKVTYKIEGTPFDTSKVKFNIDFSKIKVTYCASPIDLKEQGYIYELTYVEYSGATPVVLTENVDYTVSYSNNLKASSSAAVIFTGKGKYQGQISRRFSISKFDITEKPDDTGSIHIKVAADNVYPYMKGGSEPVPVIQLVEGDDVLYTLQKDKDFTIKYYSNTKTVYRDTSKPAMVVNGKGNFSGMLARIFDITEADISDLTVTATDIIFQNKAGICKPKVTVTDLNGRKLSAGTDYKSIFTYRYDENVIVRQVRSGGKYVSISRRKGDTVDERDIVPARTTVRVGVSGINKYHGSKSVVITYSPMDISKAGVNVINQYFTGTPIEPDKSDITVKYGGVQLGYDEYDIVSYSNNINQGTAKITIVGKGNYSGTKTVSFKILKRSMYYMVSFRANGGAGTMPALTVVKDGTPLKTNIYKKTGNIFVGWNTHEDGSGDFIADRAPINLSGKEGSVVVLYAQWKPGDYTITYNLDGGTNDAANPDSYTYGQSIVLRAPEKIGYRFEGWHMNTVGGVLTEEIAPNQYGNIKLVAKWKPISYYIELDGNGGKTLAGTTVDKGMPTQRYGTASALKANIFSYADKNFYRWSTNKDGTGLTFADKASVKNLATEAWTTVTLYAQWVPANITSSIAYGDDFIAPYGCKFNLKTDNGKCLYSYTLTNKKTGTVVRQYKSSIDDCKRYEITNKVGFSGIAKGEYELKYYACNYSEQIMTTITGDEYLMYILDTGSKVSYKVNVIVE